MIGSNAGYVNPEAIGVDSGTVFLGGFPNYVWGQASEQAVRDELVGVSIHRDGSVQAIPRPPNSLAHTPFLAPVEEGLLAVFGVSTPDGLASAVWDGRQWIELLRLPHLDGSALTHLNPSRGALAAAGRTGWFITLDQPRDRLVLMRYTERGWELLAPRPGGEPRPHVFHVAFAEVSERSATAVYMQSDITRGRTGSSLRIGTLFPSGIAEEVLFTWDGSTRTKSLEALMSRDTVAALVGEPSPTAYWGSASSGVHRSVIARGEPQTDAHLVELVDGSPGIVAQQRTEGPGGAIVSLWQVIDGVYEKVDQAPSPLSSLQGARVVADQLILIGMAIHEASDPIPFTTSIVRFSLECS